MGFLGSSWGRKVYTNCVQDIYFSYQISESTQLTSDFFILSLSVYGNRSLSKKFFISHVAILRSDMKNCCLVDN